MKIEKKKLLETYLNFWTDEDGSKSKNLDEVWELIENSYRNIGGPHKDKEELLEDKYFWKVVRKNNKLVAVCIYKNEHGGRKLVLAGTDGTKLGKDSMLKIIQTNMQIDRPNNQFAWAEVSDAIEHYIVDKWGCTPIPSDVAVNVLANIGKADNIVGLSSDGYHYKRVIEGDVFEKLLVGYPPEHLKEPIRSPKDLALYTNERKGNEKMNESFVPMLFEDKVVKFSNKVYPKFGWCVIMCGAPGSGKSTVLNNLVPIDSKVYNPDSLKEIVVRLGKINKETNSVEFGKSNIPLDDIQEPYTLKNSEYVTHLHKKLKPLDRKVKQGVFDMSKTAYADRLPNVAFDIAGSDIEDLDKIITSLKPYGYKFCVVWVFNTIENTLRNNRGRDRVGLEELVIQKYFDVLNTIPVFMNSENLMKYVNDFWIVLPVAYRVNDSESRAKYVKETNVKRIPIVNNKAELTDELVDIVYTSQKDALEKYRKQIS